MKKETKSKILNVLFFISLIICLFLISNTYAKYLEQLDTNYQSSAKMWKVIVNDKIIREQTSLYDVVRPRLDNNDYVLNDLIVPGREGYFDMEINFSSVGVPFKIDFSVEQNETEDGVYNKLPDFKYLGYTLEEKDVFYYNLPEGYTQLDFLESNGTQYVDILDKGSTFDKVEIKKIHTGDTQPSFKVVPHNNDDRNAIIFATYGANPEDGITNYETTQIYGCKMYWRNVIVRELVPCYRNSDETKGFYDMITNRFFANSGTGTFANTSTEMKDCVIDPNSTDYTDKKAHAIGCIRWIDGDGTEESLEDELNNTEDTAFIKDVSNTDVKYKASIIFEQYIEE